MLIKITLVVVMVLYAFILCESLFYMLVFSSASKKMDAATYIGTKKLIDGKLGSSLSVLYWITLSVFVNLASFCVVNPNGLLFCCTVISLIAILLDWLLMIRGNGPLNKMIREWTTTQYPENWKQLRSRWFIFYHIRQVLSLTGFFSLVTGVVFGL